MWLRGPPARSRNITGTYEIAIAGPNQEFFIFNGLSEEIGGAVWNLGERGEKTPQNCRLSVLAGRAEVGSAAGQ